MIRRILFLAFAAGLTAQGITISPLPTVNLPVRLQAAYNARQGKVSIPGSIYFAAPNHTAYTFGATNFFVCAMTTPSELGIPGGSNLTIVQKDHATTGWALAWLGGTGFYGFSARNFNSFVSAATYGAPNSLIPVQLCGGVDNTNSVIKVNVNGGAFDTDTLNTALATGTGQLTIGGDGPGQYDGSIGRVQIFSRLLTQSETSSLYNGGYGLKCRDIQSNFAAIYSAMTACWDMDEPQASYTSYTVGIPPIVAAPTAGNSFNKVAFSETPIETVHRMFSVGDSITAGFQVSAADTYPAQLGARLGNYWESVNLAISGAQAGTGALNTVNQISRLSSFNVTDGKCYVTYMAGINNLAGGETAASLETKISTDITAIHTAGCTAIILTITPCSFAGPYCDATCQARRLTVNTWITAGSSGADYVVDVAADTRLDDSTDTAVYQDGLHPTALGDQDIAQDIQCVIGGFAIECSEANQTATLSVIPAAGYKSPNPENGTFRIGEYQAVTKRAVAGGTITPLSLVKINSSGVAALTATTDINGAVGVSMGYQTANHLVDYAMSGTARVLFDGVNIAAGDMVVISSINAGQAHAVSGVTDCGGIPVRQQIVGKVKAPGAQGTPGFIELTPGLLGCGTAGNLEVVGRTTVFGTTTLITTPAGEGNAQYQISYTLLAKKAGNAVNLTLTLGWTTPDDSSTAQTTTSANVAMNTVGNNTQGVFTILTKANTTITYATALSGAIGAGEYDLYLKLVKQ